MSCSPVTTRFFLLIHAVTFLCALSYLFLGTHTRARTVIGQRLASLCRRQRTSTAETKGATTPRALRQPIVMAPGGSMPTPHIVDLAQLLEEYAWVQYCDLESMKRIKSEFRSMDRDDVHFEINLKKLIVIHDEPDYCNLTPSSAKPYTLFKTVFSNSTGLLFILTSKLFVSSFQAARNSIPSRQSAPPSP